MPPRCRARDAPYASSRWASAVLPSALHGTLTGKGRHEQGRVCALQDEARQQHERAESAEHERETAVHAKHEVRAPASAPARPYVRACGVCVACGLRVCGARE